MPAAVWHQHEEDVHALALAAHDDSHFCELDLLVCDSRGPLTDCHHQAHMEKGHSKCFSCQFHFTKHFDISKTVASITCNGLVVHEADLCMNTPAACTKRASNKGPPSLI
ncbi:MAG: hypothetical protein IT247_04130 [Bacteroidia bacterium]|nr:hypothetical protein [Bacteroidia bacterium]